MWLININISVFFQFSYSILNIILSKFFRIEVTLNFAFFVDFDWFNLICNRQIFRNKLSYLGWLKQEIIPREKIKKYLVRKKKETEMKLKYDDTSETDEESSQEEKRQSNSKLSHKLKRKVEDSGSED